MAPAFSDVESVSARARQIVIRLRRPSPLLLESLEVPIRSPETRGRHRAVHGRPTRIRRRRCAPTTATTWARRKSTGSSSRTFPTCGRVGRDAARPPRHAVRSRPRRARLAGELDQRVDVPIRPAISVRGRPEQSAGEAFRQRSARAQSWRSIARPSCAMRSNGHGVASSDRSGRTTGRFRPACRIRLRHESASPLLGADAGDRLHLPDSGRMSRR